MSGWQSAVPAARAWFVSDLTAARFAESALAFTGSELIRLERDPAGQPTITTRHPACSPAIEERRGYIALLTPEGTELIRCTTLLLPQLAAFRSTVLESLTSPTSTSTRPPPPHRLPPRRSRPRTP